MYQVLARKYRPKNFHQLLGQAHVSQALVNAIDQQRLHHAYLFTGTRGVGKTTIARILAKCLNCETGVTSQPCGRCNTCQAIDAGRFIDLIEIDAASRTKVEDTRELLENVPYAPTQGRYKVYLIDEVHMLSTHSFNALLKTLEEPPEHVKFLLATTDPQKLPITIISRCLQFVLRPMLANQLVAYLAQILRQEHIAYDEQALWQLAHSAKGSVRDALSLTDQAIAFGGGEIHADTIEQMLGLIDQADLVLLLTAIATQQLDTVSGMMRQLRAQMVDAKAVLDTLADILHQVALVQVLPSLDLSADMGLAIREADKLTELARQIAPPLVQLYYDIVVKSREQLTLANTPQQALDMCLLRLLAFKPLAPEFVPISEVDNTASASNRSPDMLGSKDQTLTSSQTAINHEKFEPLMEAETLLNTESNLPISEPQETFSVGQDKNDDLASLTIDNQQSFLPSDTIQVAADPQDQIAIDDQNFNPNFELSASVTDTQSTVGVTPPLVSPNHEVNDQFNAELNVPDIPHTPEINVADPQSVTTLDLASPFSALRPAKQILEGEWTPEKWDYWVFEARQHQWLTSDELTLAKQGYVQGHIHGMSEFITADTVLSQSSTFANLTKKLGQHFAGLQLRLSVVSSHAGLNTPAQADNERDQHAHALAKQQIRQSPVMQTLANHSPNIDFEVSLNPHWSDLTSQST